MRRGQSAVHRLSCAKSIVRQIAFSLLLKTKQKAFVGIRRIEMCAMGLRPRSPLLGTLPGDRRG
jgi:hypothetical protein